MAAKKDAAAGLAGKLVGVLDALRRLDPASYPTTLRKLAELADPSASEEFVVQAAKKKAFSDRAVVVRPMDPNSPVALAEDAELLADSVPLLEYAVGLACTPSQPACDVAKLKAKVPLRIRGQFQASVNRRIEENDLPNGVAFLAEKKKRFLHLTRYALPRPSHVVLAENMVAALRTIRERGGKAYPLALARLVEMTPAATDPKLLKQAVATPVFQQTMLVAMKNRPESPVALAEDAELLAGSSILIETALRLTRTEASQVCTPAALAKNVIPALKKPVEEAVRRRIEARRLPPGIGCLRDKKKYLLFLTSDVVSSEGVPAAAEPARDGQSLPSPAPALPEALAAVFGRKFDEAFRQLDRQGGSHNSVSLVELRRLLPLDRPTFDAELRRLRRAGRYTLSAAEGRHSIRPEEREAGVVEDGTLLLYVSRKLS